MKIIQILATSILAVGLWASCCKTCQEENLIVPIDKFEVVLSSNPINGGSTIGSGIYTKDTTVVIKAIPNLGYEFTKWTGDTTSILSSLSIVVNKDKAFVANYMLSLIPPPPPINCPTIVNLKTSGDFTVLAKAGISATGVTAVVGDIGVSPVTSTSITGFGLILPAGGAYSTSSLVSGKCYAPDYNSPTPVKMTTAIGDMETAYTTANGMVAPVPTIGLGAGNITGLTLAPGIYKWGTGLLISNPGVTLDSKGDNCGTFIFQIAQDLTVGPGAKVILSGGTQAKNIFWIVAGGATLNTTADFSGNILSKTLISLKTGAKVTGRLFAQTAVTLDGGTAVKPF